MSCGNINCAWWSDFPSSHCKGQGALVKNIWDCYNYIPFDCKNHRVAEKEMAIVRKIINPIMELDVKE